jgi:SAM-dependent methyltransferase
MCRTIGTFIKRPYVQHEPNTMKTATKNVYDYPEYYSIAVGVLRDVKKEVDFIDKAAKRFAKCKVDSVLEIGCGDSPYMEELSKSGYKFKGLDLSNKMLEYSRKKAENAGISAELICADMLDFSLNEKVGLSYVLFGSLYRTSNDDFLQHLKCVADSLEKGGIYILHMVVEGDFRDCEGTFSHEAKKGNISIKAVFDRKVVNFSKQLREESFTLHVNDKGKEFTIYDKVIDKFILPSEFKFLVEKSDFEFVDWFDGFDLDKRFDEQNKCEFVVCVIRKK